MERYGIIENKNKREILLLRSHGCVYKECTFCDYYHDSSANEDENYAINKAVLDRVTGKYSNLEVINSGSVFEIDEGTMGHILSVCGDKGIRTIHFEAHYLYDGRIGEIRRKFDGYDVKMKLGLETFDYDLRENVLKKGINEKSPERISRNFDEANFLFGINGQNYGTMMRDIELGLKYFELICINIMNENSTNVRPDADVIKIFLDEIYPQIRDDERIDILIDNTDFGVGE